MKRLIFFAIILSGCSRAHHTKTVSIDKTFNPYINIFLFNANQEGQSIIIDDLTVHLTKELNESTTLGRCFYSGPDSTPQIRINESDWISMTEAAKEQLIDHELGHCILKQHHDNNLITDLGEEIPESIMYPTEISDDYFLTHYQHYMYELFHRSSH